MKKKRKRWQIIADLFRDSPLPVTGVELGVYRAENAVHLLELMPDLFLYCVDRWKQYPRDEIANPSFVNLTTKDQRYYDKVRREALQALRPHLGRVKIIESLTVEAAAAVPNELDFVFVDAGHTEQAVLADLEVWTPKVRPGGWIIGHDYGSKHHPGVKRAVNLFFPAKRIRKADDHVFLVRKRG